MRLFVAINVPLEIRDKLAAARQKLADAGADVRWVAPDNLHITLKFLGEVEDAHAAEVLERITRAAAQVPVFPLEIEGFDRLPPKGPARIIMSRVLSPDRRITKLHRLVDSAIGGMGLPMDTRVLVPHLTLGRVSSNRGLNRLLRLLEKHDLDFLGSFPVNRITLYQSLLGPGGSRYIKVGSAPLVTTSENNESAP